MTKIIDEQHDEGFFQECEILVKNYKKRQNISTHNVALMEDMIEAYLVMGSLKNLCETISKDISIIKKDFRNLIRVPNKLRIMVNDNKLISDPILAFEIAIHATDYFDWDREESKSEDVIKLAIGMANIFKNNLNLRKEFFATNDDYSKPINVSTEKQHKLKVILEDWPVKESKYSFNRLTDRSGRQYKFLVYYSKDLDAARFVRRWEYENGQRIPKSWALEMINQIKYLGNSKEFLKKHLEEFGD